MKHCKIVSEIRNVFEEARTSHDNVWRTICGKERREIVEREKGIAGVTIQRWAGQGRKKPIVAIHYKVNIFKKLHGSMNEISSMNLLSTLSHIGCVLNVNGHMAFKKYIININMSIFEHNMQQILFACEKIQWKKKTRPLTFSLKMAKKTPLLILVNLLVKY